jgi:DNA-directed RNA polymerase subunit omega
MLRPSYTELMDIVNQNAKTDNKITSRYSIVIAAAKRARQIINGAPYDVKGARTDKAVSIAIDEIKNGKMKIFPEGLDGYDDGINMMRMKHRSAGRTAQGVALSADTVILSKDLTSDYGDDMDDELFDDEAADANTEKEYKYRTGEYEEEEAYDAEGGYSDDEYNYEEETIDMDSDDFDYDDK